MSSLPVHRSVIQADALAQALKPYYSFGAIKDCFLYTRGISDTYRLETEAGIFFLRLSTVTAQPKALADEVRILHYFVENGFPTCKPYLRQDGSYLSYINTPEGSRYALLSHAITTQPFVLSPDTAKQAGEALARMHQLLDNFPGQLSRPAHDYQYFIEASRTAINTTTVLKTRYNWQQDLWPLAEQIWEAVSTLKKEPPFFGLCHGDFMFGNCLLDSDNNLTIIDYDYSGYGWRMYDIATLIWLELGDVFQADWNKDDMLRSFLNAYQTIRRIEASEYKLLACFVALRQLFIFGAMIRNSPAFGFQWYETNLVETGLALIRLCLSDEWYTKTGLPKDL